MSKAKIKQRIYFKLMGIEVALILIMYLVVPILANYPPYSEGFKFQREVLGILTHATQYFVFGLFAIILFVIAIKRFFRDIFVFLDSDKNFKHDYKEIAKIRNQCYKMPLKLLFFQLSMQILILLSVFLTVEIPTGMKVKFTLLYLSFFMAAWALSVVLVKNDLNYIVDLTFRKDTRYSMPERSSYFYKTLLYDLIPFFLTVVIGITLYGYATATEKKGEGIYVYYKQALSEKAFDHKTTEEIEKILSDINKRFDTDYYYIANNDFKILESGDSQRTISDFFIKYANNFIEKTNGRIYESFGLEEEGYAKKIVLENGEEAYVGFKYQISDASVVIPFISLGFVYTLTYIFTLIVWSKNVSKNIETVSEELNNIAAESKITDYRALPIVSRDEIGKLTDAYNKIQLLTIDHIKQIEENKGILVEQERLVSLGQMIGGIAHNLKTPILSIAGAAEGIKLLAEEMEESLVTPTVTIDDKKEIIQEQEEWVEKIKVHLEYMNDIITAVKGQATTFTTDREERFTVKDLFKNVEILTAHEFKNSLTQIQITNNVSSKVFLKGDFNSLLQIINNIVINAIQSYDKASPENRVELIANIGNLSDDIVISVRDYGKGMSKDVQNKLFKQMVTTKGKYGTGLGLYMSYSTIKGKFHGDIKFESEEGVGTTFHIMIPDYEKSEELEREKTEYVSNIRPITGE